MQSKEYRRFYLLSLAVLLALSAYPLINGVRMAYWSIANGSIAPEQYAKYVVPYAAMGFAILLFAAFQPLLFRAGRLAFPVGLAGSVGVFFAMEQFFERMQIRTAGMALVDPATLGVGLGSIPTATVDAWQTSLCIASPLTRAQSIAYTLANRTLYVMGDSGYKIHYYLIALLLIAMVCALVYGIGRMARTGERSQAKPLLLQGMATSALLALCVFANTTAFFRQADAIQTPLASVLTGVFFVGLGTAVGVYAGSFLLGRRGWLGIGVPVLLALTASALMYAGEAAMMAGGLYRFGTGWFYERLGAIPLAPVDVLVVLLAGAATWVILSAARRRQRWPGMGTAIASLLVCALIAAGGIGFSMAAPEPAQDASVASPAAPGAIGDIAGCYVFDECLYMNPLSSMLAAKGSMPYVYGVGEDALIIANTQTGDTESLPVQFIDTPVAEDEFSSKGDLFLESYPAPDLSRFRERWLRAIFPEQGGRQLGLYRMDDETWLVTLHGGKLWSIYRLIRTDATTLADLRRALAAAQGTPEGQRQMTLQDVYDLARRIDKLTLRDFERFEGRAVGPTFALLRYDVAGGCVLLVRSDRASVLNYAHLSKQGYDPFDPTLCVDIRQGAQAVAAYLDPVNSLTGIKIEDSRIGSEGRELLYEGFGYRYDLNSIRADRIFVTFENGDRLPIKQALEERRLLVEDAVANGLAGVLMEPMDNPLKGYFPILHHLHKFTIDDMAFFPSPSFYFMQYEGLTAYFDLDELTDTLDHLGKGEQADRLRKLQGTSNLTVLESKSYITDAGLAQAGFHVEIGWALSSHTPVQFKTEGK